MRSINYSEKIKTEVVQLYIRDVLTSVTTYEKTLRGFERVHLEPGETKEVSFEVLPRDLQLLNKEEQWVVEPGTFKIMIGASSEDIRLNEQIEVVAYGHSTASLKESDKAPASKSVSASISEVSIHK